MTIVKTVTATVLAGGVALGAMVFWNGSETLNEAKTTITEYAERINLFEDNENALVAKLQELKSVRDNLQTQIDQNALDIEEMALLQTQLDEANAQIAEYEADLQTTTERITALENELNKANSEAEQLQLVMDENQTEAQPLSAEEMAALVEEVPAEEADPYTLNYVHGQPTLTVSPGVTLSTSGASYKIENKSGKDVKYLYQPGGMMSTLYNGNYKLIPTSAVTIEVQVGTEIYTIHVSE